jgi:outer membrane protein assembly factor BamB
MKHGAIILTLTTAISAAAADCRQWGTFHTRNMVSAETGLPDKIDPTSGLNLKWKAKLGTESHSTAVVAGGKVFIGTNNEDPRDPRHHGDRSALMCFDESDGHFLWQILSPKLTNSIYWDWPKAGICTPPSIEGNRGYFLNNRGEVVCFDVNGLADGNQGPYTNEAAHAVPAGSPLIDTTGKDGDILWLFDNIKECGVRQHDQAYCSILIDGPFLYLNTCNGVDDSHRVIQAPNAPSLIVLDKTSGRLLAADGEHIGSNIFHSTWAPPTLGTVNNKPRIFFAGGDGILYGFEPLQSAPRPGEVATLQRVWKFDCDPTAPKTNIHQYLTNRKTSPSNIMSTPVFDNGRLYVTVGGDLWWGKNESQLQCIDTRGEGDVTGKALLWSLPLGQHSIATPSVWNGLVFVTDCSHKVYCVDAATGKICWSHNVQGEFWGSTLVADGKVYVGSCKGEFLIFEASREKKILCQTEFDTAIHATPVAANGVIYVSTQDTLYAFKTK